MQSNNPILTRVETYTDLADPMTIQGAIQKSVLLTVIAAVVGLVLFFYCATTGNLSIAYAAAIVGAIILVTAVGWTLPVGWDAAAASCAAACICEGRTMPTRPVSLSSFWTPLIVKP